MNLRIFYSLFLMPWLVFQTAFSQMVIKNSSNSTLLTISTGGNVGIGGSVPDAASKLDVQGQLKMTGFRLGTSATAGMVLKSDASGNGTWQTSGISGIQWHDVSNMQTTALLARKAADGDPNYLTSLYHWRLPDSDYPYILDVGIGLTNAQAQSKATMRVQADTAQLFLTSRASSTDYTVEVRAATAYPTGLEPGISRRLYTNSGLFVTGSGSRFENFVGIAVNALDQRTAGYLSLGVPGDTYSKLRLRTYGEANLRGYVWMPYLTETTTTPSIVKLASGSILVKEASSLRYKENVLPLQRDFAALLQAEPISFTYRDSKARSFGYAAESFLELGLQDLVQMTGNGDAKAIYYDKLSVYLLELAKNHEKRITALEKKQE